LRMTAEQALHLLVLLVSLLLCTAPQTGTSAALLVLLW
jgi:hypothetical protein